MVGERLLLLLYEGIDGYLPVSSGGHLATGSALIIAQNILGVESTGICEWRLLLVIAVLARFFRNRLPLLETLFKFRLNHDDRCRDEYACFQAFPA